MSLTELYIDNNQIQDVQEGLKLKDLPDVSIVDCSYNPMTQNKQHYRSFTIYHLRKLRVLDGISID